MKKFFYLIPLLLILPFATALANENAGPASSEYHYSIDLNQIEDDRIKVELISPKTDQSSLVFQMPSMVPGTYSVYDFGRFVSNFKAVDEKGKALPVKKLDVNSWRIDEAQTLHKISYDVDDTWDYDGEGAVVFEPVGSNIEAGKNFVLNTNTFAGYFEGLESVPFNVTFSRPSGFFGSTSLERVSTTPESDTYKIGNYHDLIDAPLMYCRPDTTYIEVANARVLVSVYSPNNVITSSDVADNIRELLQAQNNYLGGELPVDHYAFIIYLTDKPGLSGGMGALEHSYSSVYFLPEWDIEHIGPMVRDVCAHEFFHIITPLNIHSEYIDAFDFANPAMSRHLWLYEGVTEYSAGHVQIYEGLMDEQQFVEWISEKMDNAGMYNDNLPFTEMSKGCLDQYKDQYTNVYQKGALIGMALDIRLRQYSNGAYGIRDLMAELSAKYGISKPFEDDKLFDIIAEMTYPEIRTFFSKYVEGSESLPFEDLFAAVGLKNAGNTMSEEITLGHVAIGVDPAANKLIIADVTGLNSFGKKLGWQKDDLLISLNGKELSFQNVNDVFEDFRKNTRAGDKVKVEVLRTNKKGKEKTVKLKAKAQKVIVVSQSELALDPNATPAQLTLRKKWMGTGHSD